MGRSGLFPQAPGAVLFHFEALAVGALHHSGVGLVGAHLDLGQTAVLGILAVMGAVIHGALDALVGGAGTAAVGAILVHKNDPPA